MLEVPVLVLLQGLLWGRERVTMATAHCIVDVSIIPSREWFLPTLCPLAFPATPSPPPWEREGHGASVCAHMNAFVYRCKRVWVCNDEVRPRPPTSLVIRCSLGASCRRSNAVLGNVRAIFLAVAMLASSMNSSISLHTTQHNQFSHMRHAQRVWWWWPWKGWTALTLQAIHWWNRR